MPILSGQGIAGWKHLDVGVQCWVLVALKEGLAAADMHVLHQHALAVLALCHNLLKSEATSVHLIAPVLGLVSEVSIPFRHRSTSCMSALCMLCCMHMLDHTLELRTPQCCLNNKLIFLSIKHLPALLQRNLCC